MGKIIKISVLVLFEIFVISGCEKENSDNPTNGQTSAAFNSGIVYGTMTDQDGNIYKTVTIGTQVWMAENLRTTRYRNGSVIPNITDNTAWVNLTTAAYCNYNNTKSADSIATYGRLYNWYALTNSNNIAPAGWHVPTPAEWITLITQLGGESVAGGKMKETGQTHWFYGNIGATNESGFTALPSGVRYPYASPTNHFGLKGHYAYYWSSTFTDPNNDLGPVLFAENATVGYSGYDKTYGVPVRLVKD